jgi:hypothetical protein
MMLANARTADSTTVHHGILAPWLLRPIPDGESEWAGALCASRPPWLGSVDFRNLKRTRKPVTCLRCLRMARRGKP